MKKNIASNNKQLDLGKTLIIVNPVAQSGKGSQNGQKTFHLFKEKYKQDVDLFFTTHCGHATSIAADSAKYDSIIVVGGDGVVHETACGLMKISKKDRPVLGVVPIGSGNDYARSLGISFKAEKAIDEIMHSKIKSVDIGKCNNNYFLETLSFGIDAGIAVATMKARQKSKEKGFKLYFKCGIDQILHHFNSFKFTATLDNKEKIKGNSYIFAIQIGRTYGGGFQITPNAKLSDGLFDICYSCGEFSRKKALAIFVAVSKGKHQNMKSFKFKQASKIKLTLEDNAPCQMDGEEYSNTKFNIEILHKELKVYSIN